MTAREYTAYCAAIPIGGAGDAITRAELARKWGIDDRTARYRIADMRTYEAPDVKYVICSSSHGASGYYRTANPDEIAEFIRETSARACHTFAPITVARRVLARWYEDGTPRQMRVELTKEGYPMSMECVNGGPCKGCMNCLGNRPAEPEPAPAPEPKTYADMLRAALAARDRKDVFKFIDAPTARRATQGMCMARRKDRASFDGLHIQQHGVSVHVWL